MQLFHLKAPNPLSKEGATENFKFPGPPKFYTHPQPQATHTTIIPTGTGFHLLDTHAHELQVLPQLVNFPAASEPKCTIPSAPAAPSNSNSDHLASFLAKHGTLFGPKPIGCRPTSDPPTQLCYLYDVDMIGFPRQTARLVGFPSPNSSEAVFLLSSDDPRLTLHEKPDPETQTQLGFTLSIQPGLCEIKRYFHRELELAIAAGPKAGATSRAGARPTVRIETFADTWHDPVLLEVPAADLERATTSYLECPQGAVREAYQRACEVQRGRGGSGFGPGGLESDREAQSSSSLKEF